MTSKRDSPEFLFLGFLNMIKELAAELPKRCANKEVEIEARTALTDLAREVEERLRRPGTVADCRAVMRTASTMLRVLADDINVMEGRAGPMAPWKPSNHKPTR